jgi:hypothetical protein
MRLGVDRLSLYPFVVSNQNAQKQAASSMEHSCHCHWEPATQSITKLETVKCPLRMCEKRSNVPSDTKHAHNAILESRRSVISFLSMQAWTRARKQRLRERVDERTKERRERWKDISSDRIWFHALGVLGHGNRPYGNMFNGSISNSAVGSA